MAATALEVRPRSGRKNVRRPVSRVLSPRPGRSRTSGDDHSSGPPVAGRFSRPLEIYGYTHHPYNAAKGERGGTAAIKGFWGMLKRGINGTYISVSQKHLQSYLNEFEFRYNLRHEPHTMFDRLLLSFPRRA